MYIHVLNDLCLNTLFVIIIVIDMRQPFLAVQLTITLAMYSDINNPGT